MSDKEKFEAFKKDMIDENEKKYGKEIRETYGEKTVEESNKKLKEMTKEDLDTIEKLGEELIEEFLIGFKENDPKGESAQRGADLHRQWLSYYWSEYTKEAHIGVTQMYVDDERFKAYYDKHQEGLAEFMLDAVKVYAK